MIQSSYETFQVIDLDDIPDRLWGWMEEMNEDSYVLRHLTTYPGLKPDELDEWLRANVEGGVGDKVLIERR